MKYTSIVSFLIAILFTNVHQGFSKLSTNEGRKEKNFVDCGVSLLNQGVYNPDSRFNAFADGVMINTVAEAKRRKMDPLYFRVHNQGVVEHVSTSRSRGKRSIAVLKQERQSGAALGGGVVRGLSNVKRFGIAEVQIAGNTTLIRSHWLIGPVFIIIDYRGEPLITRVRTELQAVQFDTLTGIDKFGAEMKAFRLLNPLFDYMAYYGNRTMAQQRTTEQTVRNIFADNSFMVKFLKEAFEVASYDKIIPQFGVDDNYYSVLQYLFSGNQRRVARLALQEYQDEHREQLLSSQQHLIYEESNPVNDL